jgi:predicted transcriptional regulator
MQTVDITKLDLRLKHFRVNDKKKKEKLLASIAKHGMLDPCLCIDDNFFILLDGFKRYWCAKKLSINIIPIKIVAKKYVDGLIDHLRDSKRRTLNTLEQASMVEEIKNNTGMSTSEIALQLDCSPAWVSLRTNLLNNMSEVIREAIFSGKFPIRSYMYTLRKFTRVKNIKQKDLDKLVLSISSKSLSSRDADKIIEAYFSGGKNLKKEICHGDPEWALKQFKLQKVVIPSSNWDEKKNDNTFIDSLTILQNYITRVSKEIDAAENSLSKAEESEACLLICGICKTINELEKQLRIFYDKRR